MESPKRASFDLYIDESGSFIETTAEASDTTRRQIFPSQLAGLLVHKGALQHSSAVNVLRRSLDLSGLEFTGSVHASEFQRGPAFDRLKPNLLLSFLVDNGSQFGW